MNIGVRIRLLRERRDWTQKSLAEKVGINHSVFNRIESGERKVRSDELSRIADALGVSTDFLSGNVTEPKKHNDGDTTIRLLEEEARKMGLTVSDPRFQKLLNDAFDMLSGKLDYDMFSDLMEEENAKVETWKAELETLNTMIPNTTRTKRDVARSINELNNNWSAMTHQQRKTVVQQLFEAIVIKKEGNYWHIVGYKLSE